MSKKRILFVCVENSNRSQMAEAFARIHGGGEVEAFSAAGSRVLFRLARAFVIFALCVSLGAHWAALQSVAWATMLVENAKHESLAAAVAMTFDGDHPCGLCKHITAAAQHEQKQNQAQPVHLKPDLICATRAVVLSPRASELSYALLKANASARVQSPPTPPPRFALS